MSRPDPRTEYETRLQARSRTHELLARRDSLVSNARLVAFLTAVGLAGASFFVSGLHLLWSVIPLAAYVVLVVVHDRIIRTKERAAGAVEFYRRGIARLDGTWPGAGVTRQDLAAEDHPYAADLDLFGQGSLFDLICTARTREGEQTLASWLLEPASPEEISLRHDAVRELAPRLDLREEMALVGGSARAGVHPDSLSRWAGAEEVFGPRRKLWMGVCAALALGAVLSLLGWIFAGLGPVPLLVVALAEWIVNQVLGKQVKSVITAVTHPHQQLTLLAAVLGRIEGEDLQSEKLATIRETLTAGGRRASRAIGSLASLVGWLDAPRNVLFAPIAYVLMWRPLFALVIEGWRLGPGRRIGRWLQAVGQFEALSSISSHAHEHPGDAFARIVEDGPVLDAKDLAHPLLAEAESVANHIRLGDPTRAMIVSGSNMSGKSTLLRTVGIAAVMALAGAPVRARELTISSLRVGATIRIHDSLHNKTSRFYAEVKRLRQLAQMAAEGEAPLLFLLDEVFHGTNSHDRLVGATALLKDFLEQGAIGLVVTHDLAIAEAAAEFGQSVQNVHFVDRLEDGQLVFDYRLRPGVVQRSNALDLMRQVGLRV